MFIASELLSAWYMDNKRMEDHKQAVSQISSRIRSFYDKQIPFRIYHGSTNSTQHRKVDPDRMVDTSRLNHVFNINTDTKTCLAEPNVAMDELVEEVAKHGLLPPVVMEFPGITVGGGFAGTAGESSGFKYGFFDRTVNWIEIILADGEIIIAPGEKYRDLFHGAAGTLGTLGVTTLLEIRLVDFKPFVELTYHPVISVADALSTMKACTKIQSNDFVDGILFAVDRGVIISGRLVDEVSAGGHMQRFGRARDPWFYIHVDRTASRQIEPLKEFTPVRDYLFRYDRGAVSVPMDQIYSSWGLMSLRSSSGRVATHSNTSSHHSIASRDGHWTTSCTLVSCITHCTPLVTPQNSSCKTYSCPSRPLRNSSVS